MSEDSLSDDETPITYEEARRILAADERNDWIVNTALSLVALTIGLGVLFGLIRFVKFAWNY